MRLRGACLLIGLVIMVCGCGQVANDAPEVRTGDIEWTAGLGEQRAAGPNVVGGVRLTASAGQAEVLFLFWAGELPDSRELTIRNIVLKRAYPGDSHAAHSRVVITLPAQWGFDINSETELLRHEFVHSVRLEEDRDRGLIILEADLMCEVDVKYMIEPSLRTVRVFITELRGPVQTGA